MPPVNWPDRINAFKHATAQEGETKWRSGWGWMVFNGIVSLLLALLFLIGWPATSMWLVGLYISISLLFDGGALVAIGMALRKAGKFQD